MNIYGMSAIVTGAASGLGAATARLLAHEGAKVSIFDLNEAEGRKIAAEIGGIFVKTDITNEESVEAALNIVQATHDTARILINCAGIAPASKVVGRDFLPHPVETFRRAIEINLTGTFLTISRFAARLQQIEQINEERGVIINTASIAAYDGQIGQAAYAASKGGIVSLTLPLARELAASKIRVMAIAPGIFWTPMVASFPEAAQASLAAQVPHPSRLGRPEEYAMLVTSIIENPMLNGETIRIDGAVRMTSK